MHDDPDPDKEHELQAQAGVIADTIPLEELRVLADLPTCSNPDLVRRAIAVSERRAIESSLALTEAHERISSGLGVDFV